MVEVVTIGYGGKKPDAFFAELEALGADLVVDVRADPFHAFLGVYTKRGSRRGSGTGTSGSGSLGTARGSYRRRLWTRRGAW